MQTEAKEPVPYVATWTDPRTFEVKTENGVLKDGERAEEVLDMIRKRERLGHADRT